ncbi:MAG: L-threonylcarbamoyladenylate synthase [Spirochaetales bacterium]|nr:L-threonylcarbamoyladenylate synthase [Spirochaetales bacterium]
MIISARDPNYFSTVCSLLQRKMIGIVPCDTIYGLVGIAPETENKIRAAKGRLETKPFLMLTHSMEMIKTFTDTLLPKELQQFWPGPLTILFPKIGSPDKIAFRIPNDPFLLQVLEKLDRPLYSTSVNISGKNFLWDIEEMKKEFHSKVGFIVDAGNLPYAVPSTIIDISTTPATLVREGALAAKDIPVQMKISP